MFKLVDTANDLVLAEHRLKSQLLFVAAQRANKNIMFLSDLAKHNMRID